MMAKLRYLFIFVMLAGLYGCSTVQPYDYTEYKNYQPRSILVLPPKNNSVELIATYSVLSNVTLPLSEFGYYVFPVAVVDETFKQNGIFEPAEMHDVSLNRLHDIFKADSVLYMEIDEYGVSYNIISSNANVRLRAKLIDVRTGTLLWEGESFASTSEGKSQSANPIALLITAVVEQIVSNIDDDPSRNTGKVATNRLLLGNNGVLLGPRHPNFDNVQ